MHISDQPRVDLVVFQKDFLHGRHQALYVALLDNKDGGGGGGGNHYLSMKSDAVFKKKEPVKSKCSCLNSCGGGGGGVCEDAGEGVEGGGGAFLCMWWCSCRKTTAHTHTHTDAHTHTHTHTHIDAHTHTHTHTHTLRDWNGIPWEKVKDICHKGVKLYKGMPLHRYNQLCRTWGRGAGKQGLESEDKTAWDPFQDKSGPL